MRISIAVFAMSVAVASSISGTALAHAGQVDNFSNIDTLGPTVPVPQTSTQLLDCEGTTGIAGCGPGWHWRDGWRGQGCYPC